MKINITPYLFYKFFNSMFLGISVGSIFVLYTPLMPSIYSIGGILLAIAMLLVAKLYDTILNINYFYKISLFIELLILAVMAYFLVFSYTYMTALIIYIGYHITFAFGSYLVRAETLFLKKKKLLELVDVTKQKGYLLGMIISFGFYKSLEYFYNITDKQEQVYNIHFILVAFELIIIYFLIRAFKGLK